jgi:hypothetical protein
LKTTILVEMSHTDFRNFFAPGMFQSVAGESGEKAKKSRTAKLLDEGGWSD